MTYRKRMAIFGRSKHPAADVAEPVEIVQRPSLPDPPDADEAGLRPVAQHRDYLLSLAPSLRPFGVGLLDVSGLTLCESLRSDLDLPVYTAALTDGWAVRASNLVGASAEHPIALPVVGSVDPGSLPVTALSPGTTVWVPFGSAVPDGADAVVPAAEVNEIPGIGELPDGIRFTAEVAYHQNLYPRGDRIGDGDPLLPDGTVVNPRMVSMLAEVGHDKVLARPRPRVVVATIGVELVDPGLPLTRITQLYDSTTVMVAAAAHQELAQVFPIGIWPEDISVLRSILAEQLVRADLVLLVAKSSPQLIEAMSSLGPIDVADVAMWPNGPRLFGKIGTESTPVLVLPEGAIQA
ncbi:MAG: hypothetical protein LBK28_05655, partial [Propionibacteriaceae bacterium]|nr:hypothetical protein [Propionibacteriaceae bacterium]